MFNREIKECDHPSRFIRSSITNVLLLKAIYLIKKYSLSDRSYMFHPSWLPIPHLRVCVRSSSNDCQIEITSMTYRLIIHAIYYHSRLVIRFPKTSGVIEQDMENWTFLLWRNFPSQKSLVMKIISSQIIFRNEIQFSSQKKYTFSDMFLLTEPVTKRFRH